MHHSQVQHLATLSTLAHLMCAMDSWHQGGSKGMSKRQPQLNHTLAHVLAFYLLLIALLRTAYGWLVPAGNSATRGAICACGLKAPAQLCPRDVE